MNYYLPIILLCRRSSNFDSNPEVGKIELIELEKCATKLVHKFHTQKQNLFQTQKAQSK